MLRDEVGFDQVKAKVVNSFKGKKIAAYYGCLLLRPHDVMQFDNPENPTIMEDFIKAIGGTSVYYPYRNECCGGYCALEDQKQPQRLVDQILASAQENGAEMILTACPLCLYNLQHNATKHKLPVYYFTQLLYEALGLAEKEG